MKRPIATLLFGALVSAQSTKESESADLKCFTQMGAETVSYVPTTTLADVKTITLDPVTVETTLILTQIITDSQSTLTSTSTDIVTVTVTDEAVTDTFSTTSTQTETDTVTTTETTTTTIAQPSVTTVTSTSVVPAPTDFVPIQDTVSGFPARKREVRHPRCRARASASMIQASASSYIAGSTLSAMPSGLSGEGLQQGLQQQYPQQIVCSSTTTAQSTITMTITGSPSQIFVTPEPTTITTITEVTSTSTLVPPEITMTASFDETTTVTTTATETYTSTTTTVAVTTETAITQIYGACSAENLLGPGFMSGTIDNLYNYGNNGQTSGASIFDTTSTASAYDCCAKCVTTNGCTGSAFTNGACILLHNNGRTCTSQSSNMAAFVWSPGATDGLILSNSPCGYIFNGGQQ